MITMMSYPPWDFSMATALEHSNLQFFLQCITPALAATRFLPNKDVLKKPNEEGKKEGYTLNELWKSYDEWSVYGAAVPIVLRNGQRIVQYYVPSLSALQVFTKKPFSSPRSVFDDAVNTMRRSGTATGNGAQNGNGSCGYLYYQYNEMISPYKRTPLTAKIHELAKLYPGLVDIHSSDLSPYSWMAIAWYPVYQIPSSKNSKELSACFLTYHPLASLSRLQGFNYEGEDIRSSGFWKELVSLPPFALVTYKMFGSVWINPFTSDQEILTCQENAACYWLKQVQFQHHDFDFFMSRQFLSCY